MTNKTLLFRHQTKVIRNVFHGPFDNKVHKNNTNTFVIRQLYLIAAFAFNYNVPSPIKINKCKFSPAFNYSAIVIYVFTEEPRPILTSAAIVDDRYDRQRSATSKWCVDVTNLFPSIFSSLTKWRNDENELGSEEISFSRSSHHVLCVANTLGSPYGSRRCGADRNEK